MKSDEFKDQVIPFSPRLFSMCARLLGDEEEARDAVQEIMIKIWNSRTTLDQQTRFIQMAKKMECQVIQKNLRNGV